MEDNHNIKLVCFDMDGTLIKENSWYKLNLALGLTEEEDQAMYNAYINGNLPYADWIEKIATLYKERELATKERIESVLTDIPVVDEAKQLVSYLQGKGYESAIITGSFDLQANRVASLLEIKHVKANTKIVFDADGNFMDLLPAGDEIKNKPERLQELCDELGINMEESVCVGDGIGDVELFKSPTWGIALADAPKELKEQAWRIVNSLSEITEIL